MANSSFLQLCFNSALVTILIVSTLTATRAEVRSSTSYQLQSDSVNFGGGFSTSSSYSLESTAGEVATGRSGSASYSLRAGYQQMQEIFLSISASPNVTLSPAIGGLSGGVSNGSTSVVVLTDNPAGYELTIESENAPAMQKGVDTIADYIPQANPANDYTFTTAASVAHFGFSPEGSDITTAFKDNSTICGVGSLDTALACWDGLATTPAVIASGGPNQPTGATTTLRFRVEVGASAEVIAGTYVATTTLTAIPL